MTNKEIIIFLLLLTLTAFGKAAAQPYSLDKNIKPIELKLADYKKGDSLMSGKINISKITQQSKDTAYFFVKGAGIYQSVIFSAANRKSNQTLDVTLCKYSWSKPDRNGKVEGKKIYFEKFRTEGSFGIRVISKQRNPEYQLLVWVGDEPKKILMPSAFKQKTAKPKKK